MGKDQIIVTVNALQSGLPGAAGVAGPNIAGWLDLLRGDSQLAGISRELRHLQALLSAGATDADAISDSLSALSVQTTEAANIATPDAQYYLRQLGQNLRVMAGALAD